MSASTSDTSKGSTSTFVSALVLGVVVATIYMVGFFLLHTKNTRTYQPRTYLAPEGKRPAELPKGFFGWFSTIAREPDIRVGEMNGLDAYFFVRFIRTMIMLLVPYWLLSWIILIPIAAVGPNNHGKGLDMFIIGNVSKQGRLVAYMVLAVVFILYALYLIHREYAHFTDVRMTYLNSPAHAALPRSRTVIVNNLPKDHDTEAKIREMAQFVQAPVEQVWIARQIKPLEKLYDERQEECMTLEGGVTKLQRIAAKRVRKGKVAPRAEGEEAGDLAARYVPAKKLPSHKIGFLAGKTLGLFGKSVKTLEYSPIFIREHTEALALERQRLEEFPIANSAFIRFPRQSDAHTFAQGLGRNAGFKSTTTGIEVAPEDIIWNNLSMSPTSRKIRTLISWTLTIILIIIWAPLVAFVGTISNIVTICSTVKFLNWICKLPTAVVGIIEGILPPVALAVLFMVLPMFLRFLVKFQGEPRRSVVERKLWSRFWLFQIINGFLIVGIASGLVAALQNVKKTASQLPNKLADNLPKSSIFFLTLMLTVTFGNASKALSRLIPWIVSKLAFLLRGNTPRKAFAYDWKMDVVALATTWPPVALLGVIGIVYSVIQPITVAFAAVGFMLLYLVYKYTFIWVADQPDALETAGLYYPQALTSIFWGLYVLEIFLAALLILTKSTTGYACGGIMLFIGLVTIIFQIWVQRKFRKLYLFLGASPNHPVDPSAESQHHPTGKQMPDKDLMVAHQNDAAHIAGEQHGNTSGLHPHAFDHPAIWKDAPITWIADDTLGLGRYEAARIQEQGVTTSTQFARMDANGRTEVDRGPPDEPWFGGRAQ